MTAYVSIIYKDTFLLIQRAVSYLLLVNSFEHFASPPNGRLGKRLTLPQLNEDLSLLEFLLVLLKRFVDVFAIFGINDQHIMTSFFYLLQLPL